MSEAMKAAERVAASTGLERFRVAIMAAKQARSQLQGNAITDRVDMGRRSAGGRQYDGERKMWRTLGYPQTIEIDFDRYDAMYRRGDVAGRIVDAPAHTTWRRGVDLVEVDESGNPVDPEGKTPWEATVAELFDDLSADKIFERVDRAAGIGRYAVLMIGSTKATEGLDAPLDEDGISDPGDVAFLTVRHEGHAKIASWDEDERSPRFNLPETYRLTFREGDDGKGKRSASTVHWSRIIHVAEDPLEDDVFGRPRLQRAFNRLSDLAKVAGGSAEMFWSNVGGMIWGKVPPGVDIETEDKTADEVLEDVADAILAGLHEQRRVHFTQGLESLQFLGAGTPDPSGIWEMQRALISTAAVIPESVLFGTSRGDIAKSTDLAEWHGRIAERQVRFAAPTIVRPFIDRLIAVGALDAPRIGYRCEWAPLAQLDEAQLAKVTKARADAAKAISDAIVTGGPEAIAVVRILLPELEGILAETDAASLAAQIADEDRGSSKDFERWFDAVGVAGT